MPTVRYTVMDGEIVSENRNGTIRDYVPDPLGSTIALLDQNQNITDTFSYWPYGEERTRTGTTPTPFRFVGTLGYYRDSSGRTYVRAREYQQAYGRWMTVDSLLGDWTRYSYARNSPPGCSDSNGLIAQCAPLVAAGPVGWLALAGLAVAALGYAGYQYFRGPTAEPGSAGNGRTTVRGGPRVKPVDQPGGRSRRMPDPLTYPEPKSREECSQLHDDYRSVCDQERKCQRFGMDCAELLRRAAINAECYRLRQLWLEKCVQFALCEKDWRGQLGEVHRAYDNCLELIRRKGCYGPIRVTLD